MNIQILNTSSHPIPEYHSPGAAGLDLRAYIKQTIILKPLERELIPTGLSIALPKGFEAQVRPRSGLAYRHGVTVLNSPGTIDSDYRGDICVLLVNLSNEEFEIKDGHRIAQLVITKYEKIVWEKVSFLFQTQRGNKGFGSTGK